MDRPSMPMFIVDASWTEHTASSGSKYYYNSITKESSYVRPHCFQSPQQPQQQQQYSNNSYRNRMTGGSIGSSGSNKMPQTLPTPPSPPPPPKKQHISAPPMFHRPPPHMTTTPAQVTTHPQLMLSNQAMLTPISQSSATLQVPGQPSTGTVLNNAVPLHQVAPMVIPPPTFIPGRPNIIPGVLNTFPSNLPIHQKKLIPTTQHRQHVSQTHKALSDTNRAKINAKSVVDASWKESTAPSGLKYYYNSVTKESTYIRPQCSQFPHQPQQSQQRQQQKHQRKKEEAAANQNWIEYDDPATGKKYYSNGLTTTWGKPTNFQRATKSPTATKINTNNEVVNNNSYRNRMTGGSIGSSGSNNSSNYSNLNNGRQQQTTAPSSSSKVVSASSSSNKSTSNNVVNNSNNTQNVIRDRFLHLLVSMVGQNVIVTQTNGTIIEGIFHTFTPFVTNGNTNDNKKNKYVIKACHIVKQTTSTIDVEDGSTIIIPSEKVAQVLVKSMRVENLTFNNAPNSNTDEFKTDTEISNTNGRKRKEGFDLVAAGSTRTNPTTTTPSSNMTTTTQQKHQRKKEETAANQKWIEYDDPATGKKYISNGLTKILGKPTNFQHATKAPTATKTNTNNEVVNKNIKKPHKNRQADSTQQKHDVNYSNKEEAITSKGLHKEFRVKFEVPRPRSTKHDNDKIRKIPQDDNLSEGEIRSETPSEDESEYEDHGDDDDEDFEVTLSSLEKKRSSTSKISSSPLNMKRRKIESNTCEIIDLTERSTSESQPGSNTHVIFALDFSTSMKKRDVVSSNGRMSRWEAVFECVDSFISLQLQQQQDQMGTSSISVLKFNNDSEVLLKRIPLQGDGNHIRKTLKNIKKNNKPKGPSLFSAGFQGVHRLAMQEPNDKIVCVFLSDGRPGDLSNVPNHSAPMQKTFKRCGISYPAAGCFIEKMQKRHAEFSLQLICLWSEGVRWMRYLADCYNGTFHNPDLALDEHSVDAGSDEEEEVVMVQVKSAATIYREGFARARDAGEVLSLTRMTAQTSIRSSFNSISATVTSFRSGQNRQERRVTVASSSALVSHEATRMVLVTDSCGNDKFVLAPGERPNERRIKLSLNPFSQGGLRNVYRMEENDGTKQVAKESRHETHYNERLKFHVETVKCQEQAAIFAESFNKKIKIAKKTHSALSYSALSDVPPVHVLRAEVYRLKAPSCPGGFRYLAVEKHLNGEYQKYNNNDGYVKRSKCLTCQVAQAFSHFSYQKSNKMKMVVDIQGSGYVFTDPQLHSITQEFGRADRGIVGIEKFFSTHQCNFICRHLSLDRQL